MTNQYNIIETILIHKNSKKIKKLNINKNL